MTLPFFTIGHSNRSLDDFVQMLHGACVDHLVDIRAIPKSRSNPHFNKDLLPDALVAFDISYEHLAALGGLRRKTRSIPAELNGFWTNGSFHNYADYALSAQFHEAFKHLRDEGHSRRCAIMCSEAVWWRCHRRIVADYLIAHGEIVFHIMDSGRLQPARLTPGAAVQSDGTIIYPAAGHSR